MVARFYQACAVFLRSRAHGDKRDNLFFRQRANIGKRFAQFRHSNRFRRRFPQTPKQSGTQTKRVNFFVIIGLRREVRVVTAQNSQCFRRLGIQFLKQFRREVQKICHRRLFFFRTYNAPAPERNSAEFPREVQNFRVGVRPA